MTVVFGYPKGHQHPPIPPKFSIGDITFAGSYEQTEVVNIREWFSLMEAGYKASNPFSSFKAKLRYYRDHLNRAEKELGEMILGRRIGH